MRHIHTPAERLRARKIGATRARMAFVALLCGVSILRTALTRIVPLAGCSAWWVTALCCLPSLATYGLLRLAMALTRTATAADCLRVCLGPLGGWLLSFAFGILLLLDGASSMTALITLFTEGIGTRGTQITLALLTTAVLLVCLHREGLPRAVYLLRHVMLGALVVMAAFSISTIRLDSLYPLQGDGPAAIRIALQAGMSLAWPVTLLLTIPSGQGSRRTGPLLSMTAIPVAILAFVALATPHELLLRHKDLAGSLLQAVMYTPPALRTLGHCLLMLALFLAVAGAAQLATDHLCAPMGQPPRWLPYGVLLLLTATQALDIRTLWRTLAILEPWLLAPLAALALCCIPIALIRRPKR